MSDDLQHDCELGQEQLMAMDYAAAEHTLAAAERQAWELRDFDTLSRLYMPLQEARRQRRQCCGEGVVCLDLVAEGPEDLLEARHVVENYPQGQLLVAGWGSLLPAGDVRRMAEEMDLYLETFLAAVYPTTPQRSIVIAPFETTLLPPPREESSADLAAKLPPHCLLLAQTELPTGPQRGNAHTFARVTDLWERLHAPFLSAAAAQGDPMKKIAGYRKTIRVDYACELAHQKLAAEARELARMVQV